MSLYMDKSKSKKGVSVTSGLIYLTEILCDMPDFLLFKNKIEGKHWRFHNNTFVLQNVCKCTLMALSSIKAL